MVLMLACRGGGLSEQLQDLLLQGDVTAVQEEVWGARSRYTAQGPAELEPAELQFVFSGLQPQHKRPSVFEMLDHDQDTFCAYLASSTYPPPECEGDNC
jgi:hypothetical protein